MALTRKRRIVVILGLAGSVLTLAAVVYCIWVILALNPRLVGADAIALPILAAIGLLAIAGIVFTIRFLRAPLNARLPYGEL